MQKHMFRQKGNCCKYTDVFIVTKCNETFLGYQLHQYETSFDVSKTEIALKHQSFSLRH
jgi:hypothetical protein